MKCPNCDQVLAITERHRIEIDYCPSCRGVWLDKGELDKIIAYVNNQLPENNQPQYTDSIQRAFDYAPRPKHGSEQYRKKKSFFNDFFDFD
jgi:Zn-finger nucleic acid-binding protein